MGDDNLNYSKYLKVKELLTLQQPLVKPKADDELLFITVHQVYELWFKQVIYELDHLVEHLDKDQIQASTHRVDRVSSIFKLLFGHIDILETMSPVEYNQFRSVLSPASGFQSFQFRELEILGGLPIPQAQMQQMDPDCMGILQERMQKRTLRKAFVEFVTRQTKIQGDLTTQLMNVYLDSTRNSALRLLCESLVTLDEALISWRFRHFQMAERMIGTKMGSGGSLGTAYLATTLSRKFFPELWDVRSRL